MNLQESGEMYLESILVLSQEKEKIRLTDISRYMGFSKPSVSRALNLLKENNFISVDDNEIKLTKKGLSRAEKIYERHLILTQYLQQLGVSKKQASLDACKMEHDISEETFIAIKKQIKN